MSELQALGAEVVGFSVDSKFSHQAWMNQPRNQGGIAGTLYPLGADLNKEVSRAYNVLLEPAGIALRGTWIIDADGVVQAEQVTNTAIGRSSDEIVRLVQSAQDSKKGLVCPLNHGKGKTAIDPKNAKDWFAKNAK